MEQGAESFHLCTYLHKKTDSFIQIWISNYIVSYCTDKPLTSISRSYFYTKLKTLHEIWIDPTSWDIRIRFLQKNDTNLENPSIYKTHTFPNEHEILPSPGSRSSRSNLNHHHIVKVLSRLATFPAPTSTTDSQPWLIPVEAMVASLRIQKRWRQTTVACSGLA